MTTWLLAGSGLVLLVGIALAVGASLDTEAQRRERQGLADERRRRTEAITQHPQPGASCGRCPFGPVTQSPVDPAHRR